MTRAKNAGCIYVPDQYISLIRGAKKTGKPFVVNEMNFNDFIDLKALEENIKTGDIKSIKFSKILKITTIETHTKRIIGGKQKLLFNPKNYAPIEAIEK